MRKEYAKTAPLSCGYIAPQCLGTMEMKTRTKELQAREPYREVALNPPLHQERCGGGSLKNEQSTPKSGIGGQGAVPLMYHIEIGGIEALEV